MKESKSEREILITFDKGLENLKARNDDKCL